VAEPVSGALHSVSDKIKGVDAKEKVDKAESLLDKAKQNLRPSALKERSRPSFCFNSSTKYVFYVNKLCCY
jgi:hypothetical protein